MSNATKAPIPCTVVEDNYSHPRIVGSATYATWTDLRSAVWLGEVTRDGDKELRHVATGYVVYVAEHDSPAPVYGWDYAYYGRRSH